MAKAYEVIEDNGGGLHLFVFGEDGIVEYAASGIEYNPEPGCLYRDIKAIKDGADPVSEGWDTGSLDGSEISPQEYYEEFDVESGRNGGWAVVADNDGIYYGKMGYAASRALESNELEAVVDRINDSETWNIADLERLCELAGMEKEWYESDGESFESVAYAAAKKLGVEI